MTWPQSGECAQCGGEFERYRSTNIYCKKKECQSARQKVRWERWRENKEADGTFRDSANAYQRSFRERTGYARDWELRKKYGITLDRWLEMIAAADGRCEICDREGDLCVDHCHETGKVRGVLCRGCNAAIGRLGDTAERVERALNYLKRNTE
jgi:hypothetical protein